MQVWPRSLLLHSEMDSDQAGAWLVGYFCTLHITCWSTGLFGLQQATILCWTFSSHYSLAQSHLTAVVQYTFVLSPHLPRMFFLDMCSLSQKSGFLFVMFSDPSLWDFSCGSWSLKYVWDFNPFYFDDVYAVSLTSLGVYPHPCVSADCKRLLYFCESLFRVGGIHSCSFDNLGLFFNRLRGPRP